MTLEEALAILDSLLQPGYLNDTQELVFRQSWQGQSYQEIAEASGYDADYIKDVGSQLWRRLSQALGTQVTKRNIHSVLKGYARLSQAKTPTTTSPNLPVSPVNCQPRKDCDLKLRPEEEAIASSDPATPPHQDFSAAIDVSIFYGRSEELTTLKQWIVSDRCRLVALLGMGGIGKTALSVKLAKEIKHEFEYVVWKSLRNAPPLPEKLAKILKFLSNHQEASLPNTVSDRISLIIEYLQQHRCLIVLDKFDSVFQRESYAGCYREGYSIYGELLRQIAEIDHQSCLLIASREKPREIASLAGETLPVRILQLQGLELTTARQILKQKALIGTPAEIAELVESYQGNPMALKIVASSIQDLFSGEIREFLEQKETIFNGIRLWLDEQFHQLSPLEKKIMYWLAINREPVSPAELLNDIVPPIFQGELLESLESLQWRSLIEKVAIQFQGKSIASFTQQPLIREYITDQIIEKLYQEFSQENNENSSYFCSLFPFLQNYPIVKATARESVKKHQIRTLVTPLIAKLIATYNTAEDLAEKLNYILIKLREQGITPGYGGGNIFNLLCQLQIDLTGADFSDLAIWQADMRDIQLHQVNFAGANFCNSIFAVPWERNQNFIRNSQAQMIEFSRDEMEEFQEEIFSDSKIYEGMNIRGATGLTQGQKSILKALGAVE
ncbi:MAG: NB-ARC domain-containing protein [Actinomycetota bacterium]